jgi:ComF family protein
MFYKKIKNIAQFLLAMIMPKTCLICNKIIANGYFCGEDFSKLRFISKPNCNICGHPFEFEVDKNALCASCISSKPRYDKAISVFKYDEFSKDFIFSFKYKDQINLAGFFAKLMCNSVKEIMDDVDFVTPVALHKKRLKSRKYNHSALLAKHFSKMSKVSLIINLLIRNKNTKPQASLSKIGRKRNIEAAFHLNNKYLDRIKGKNILIIDDVITTGATIDNCCKVLRRAKVGKIYVLTLAKTFAGR